MNNQHSPSDFNQEKLSNAVNFAVQTGMGEQANRFGDRELAVRTTKGTDITSASGLVVGGDIVELSDSTSLTTEGVAKSTVEFDYRLSGKSSNYDYKISPFLKGDMVVKVERTATNGKTGETEAGTVHVLTGENGAKATRILNGRIARNVGVAATTRLNSLRDKFDQ